MLAFVAFVAFCMRFVWPPIVGAMAERQQKITDGLAAADRASHDLELAQKNASAQMAEAKKRGGWDYRCSQQTSGSAGR
jgi:F-type H+-transporting ATPase subunit b